MALRLSDRSLETIAAVTCMLGAFIAFFVLLQIVAAIVAQSPADDSAMAQTSEQGSWVAATSIVVFVAGVAWVANRTAARRNNLTAQRNSKWGGYLSVGGHVAYAMFHFAWPAWQT